jgi:predicted ester cyclase
MSIEANKALLKRYADTVLSGHDLAAMDEFFHSDYVQEDPPDGMGPGRDGLRQWLATWMQAFPDVRWTVEEQIGEDDQVWSRSTWEGTHMDDQPIRGRQDRSGTHDGGPSWPDPAAGCQS